MKAFIPKQPASHTQSLQGVGDKKLDLDWPDRIVEGLLTRRKFGGLDL